MKTDKEIIILLQKRIDSLRSALRDISEISQDDNPYAPAPDRTDYLIDVADDALKADDKVMKQ